MGFLDKLWDETLAGPAPETGLGKLRKYKSVSATTRTQTQKQEEIQIPITRSITVVRTPNSNLGTSSPSPLIPDTALTRTKPDAVKRAAAEPTTAT